MRERTRLADQVEARARAGARAAPTPLEFAELADAEGDEASLDDAARPAAGAEGPRRRAPSWRRCSPARPTATTPMSRSTPAPAAPSPPTGPTCCCACTPAGPTPTAWRSSSIEETAGEQAGIKSATLHGQGDQRLRLAEDRGRRPPAGAHLAVRLQRQAPHQLRLGLGLSGGRRHDRDRDQSGRRAHRHLPRLRRRRPARQQDRLGRAPDPHPHRHRRRLPDQRSQHQNRDEAWKMLRARLYELELQKREAAAAGGGGRRRPTSAGATRSAPTSCSPIRWSRTCAPTSRPPTPAACSTATSTPFMGASLAQRVGATRGAEAAFGSPRFAHARLASQSRG